MATGAGIRYFAGYHRRTCLVSTQRSSDAARTAAPGRSGIPPEWRRSRDDCAAV